MIKLSVPEQVVYDVVRTVLLVHVVNNFAQNKTLRLAILCFCRDHLCKLLCEGHAFDHATVLRIERVHLG